MFETSIHKSIPQAAAQTLIIGFLLTQARIITAAQVSVIITTAAAVGAVTNKSEGFEMTLTTAITALTSFVAAHSIGFAITAVPPVSATIKQSTSAAVQTGISSVFVRGESTEKPPKNITQSGAMNIDSTQENTKPLNRNSGFALMFNLR